MFHWHGFCWRSDKEPHQLLFDAFKNGLSKDICLSCCFTSQVASKENDTDSFYSFICKTSKVPVMNGSFTHATWPLKEFCRTMLLMHWPNWRSLTDKKDPDVTWKDQFNQLLQMTACPNFVKSQADRV